MYPRSESGLQRRRMPRRPLVVRDLLFEWSQGFGDGCGVGRGRGLGSLCFSVFILVSVFSFFSGLVPVLVLVSVPILVPVLTLLPGLVLSHPGLVLVVRADWPIDCAKR